MITLVEAAGAIQRFEDDSLTGRVGTIERTLQGLDKNRCQAALAGLEVGDTLLQSAFTVKRLAGQVNVLIHALGILLSLPHILEETETITALSLGAGNTGRPFDLETTHRVAEFKFINWRGGAESIRQNSLFKDFYLLAEYETPKQRYLYVTGKKHPLRFLQGGRALRSVMSRNNKLWTGFQDRYGNQFARVNEYYTYARSRVELIDLTEIVPLFADGFNGFTGDVDE